MSPVRSGREKEHVAEYHTKTVAHCIELSTNRLTSWQIGGHFSIEIQEFLFAFLKIIDPLEHANITIDWHSLSMYQRCTSVQTLEDLLRCIDEFRGGFNEGLAVTPSPSNKHVCIS